VLLKYLGVPPSLLVSDFVLEKETQPVVQSYETVNIPPGVKATFKRSKTVEYAVDLKLHQAAEQLLEVRARGAWIAVQTEVRAAVKAKAEKAIGQAWRVSETREQTVEVDGEKIRAGKVKIAWVEQQRTGHAKVSFGGDTYDVGFHFPESVDLVVTPVEGAKDKEARPPDGQWSRARDSPSPG
jgi:hypothetical protein